MRKKLNEDLFYKGSSANLSRLHTCEIKTPFWDKSKVFASHKVVSIDEKNSNQSSSLFNIKPNNHAALLFTSSIRNALF